MEANPFSVDDALLSFWKPSLCGESLAAFLLTLEPRARERCREALLEADALRAIQPQPNSVALSKSSAQDILGPFGQERTARKHSRQKLSVRADSSVSDHPPRFCSGG
jgi:hypothetical protein